MGGGRLLPAYGAFEMGRSPTSDRPPLGRASGACYPLAVGAGAVGVGIRHQPQSARSCELALRIVGAAGGGAPCLHVGRPGLDALPAPTASPCGVRPGPATHWLWVWRVRAWGPVTNLTARALASSLCSLWGRHEGARRRRLLPACGAPGVERSPTPDLPSFGRAIGARYPLAVGAGGVGLGTRHEPHSVRSYELALRAVGAARGAWGGGRFLPACGASGVGPSSTPDRLSFGHAAGARYPLAVGAV